MEHPEIQSKLSVTTSVRGAQVSLTNGYPTTPMSLNELMLAAQTLCQAVDEVKQKVRAEEALKVVS